MTSSRIPQPSFIVETGIGDWNEHPDVQLYVEDGKRSTKTEWLEDDCVEKAKDEVGDESHNSKHRIRCVVVYLR